MENEVKNKLRQTFMNVNRTIVFQTIALSLGRGNLSEADGRDMFWLNEGRHAGVSPSS